MKVAGLMSGTSLDGIDVAVLEVMGQEPATLRTRFLGFATAVHPDELRGRLLRAVELGGPQELAHLHRELGRAFGRALNELLQRSGIQAEELAAVGSHGQTVWHAPPEPGAPGATLQLGCPHTLAEETGVPVVSDFRSRDVAAGGHGAPLVPWPDWVLLRRPGQGRALQNLGGMGNVTWLPAEGGPEGVQAFDTGPGVALLDGAAREASGGRDPWDVDGRRARRGSVQESLLEGLLEHPFFQLPPPRSTGRESFGEAYLGRIVQEVDPKTEADWDDLLATLTALTARSVARSYRDHLPVDHIHEVVLTGGGARNPALVDALTQALDPLPVHTGSQALGMDPDAREAAAFALLAWAHLQGVPGNLPQVTGAAGPRVLGSLTPGRGAGQ